VGFYVYKLVFPLWLGWNYGRTPQTVLSSNSVYVMASVPLLLIGAMWYLRRRARLIVVGSLLFVASLVPVLGLVQFDFQWLSTVAYRYLYLGMLGPAMALAWGTSRLRGPGIACVCVYLAALGMLSSAQASRWRNQVAIWQQELHINPASWLAHNDHGNYLRGQGQSEAAAGHWREAIRLKNDYAEPRASLGNYLLNHGRCREAVALLRQAIRLNELKAAIDVTPVYNDLGLAFMRLSLYGEAVEAFQEVVARSPGFPGATINLQMARSRVTGPLIPSGNRPY
jgi:tetratricopeptide (TPR) repeat protein